MGKEAQAVDSTNKTAVENIEQAAPVLSVKDRIALLKKKSMVVNELSFRITDSETLTDPITNSEYERLTVEFVKPIAEVKTSYNVEYPNLILRDVETATIRDQVLADMMEETDSITEDADGTIHYKGTNFRLDIPKPRVVWNRETNSQEVSTPRCVITDRPLARISQEMSRNGRQNYRAAGADLLKDMYGNKGN